MTKDEVLKLIDRKIDESFEYQAKWPLKDGYYYGVIEGLKRAKAIIGMLDCKNNHLWVVYKMK